MNLSDRQQRYTALALLMLVISLIVAMIASPAWWAYRRYETRLTEMNDSFARYSRVAAMKTSYEMSLARVQKANVQRFYLRGASATVAGAELQTLVTRIVEAQGGKVTSSQALPPKDENKAAGVTKIAVSLQMTASITPLQLVLHSIETNEPNLFIDQMSVRAQTGRGFRLVPGVQPEYAVQLTVHGYMSTTGGGH